MWKLKDYYDELEQAKNAVRRGKAWAALKFSDKFTEALKNRTDLTPGADRSASEIAINQSEISVWLDQSSEYIS